MRPPKTFLLITFLVVSLARLGHTGASFVPQELFRIPFGDGREELGARIDSEGLSYPRDFSIDTAGRFYIDDRLHHRVARYSPVGQFEASFTYPATAQQVFAHADDRGNLWLLISDPKRGLYYGVHDPRGKPLRSAVFSQFHRFRLLVGDDGEVRAILGSDKPPVPDQVYRFDTASMLMKKEPKARPPETHHEVRTKDGVYLIDQMPDQSGGTVNRITGPSRKRTKDIRGTVVYVTDQGEIYAREGARQLYIYDLTGSLEGKVALRGLSSSCGALRFDGLGNLYQLDGIPDRDEKSIPKDDPRSDLEDRHYSPEMPGMRILKYERRL